ncbi:MAG: rhamnogalacturonan acetylesterase [Gemmatimonadaceae bacterium]|nr:rhamnogalacturonan acetylesterase [Chitinophagaceae bacterium]
MKSMSSLLLIMFMLMSSTQDKVTVWLAGDSTMSVKDPKAYPEYGWGMPFASFFDSTVSIENRAMNGRSTKSFLAENRWKPMLDNMKKGDYVLIQFGHNDEVPTKKTYTTEKEFQDNLKYYILSVREKQAIPILLTPVARRKFDHSGNLESTHEVYSGLVRAVALENDCLLIDLDKKSQDLITSWGVQKSTLLFNHLAAGEHPNYPDGREDNTHFSELGARMMAQIVFKELTLIAPELTNRTYKKR